MGKQDWKWEKERDREREREIICWLQSCVRETLCSSTWWHDASSGSSLSVSGSLTETSPVLHTAAQARPPQQVRPHNSSVITTSNWGHEVSRPPSRGQQRLCRCEPGHAAGPALCGRIGKFAWTVSPQSTVRSLCAELELAWTWTCTQLEMSAGLSLHTPLPHWCHREIKLNFKYILNHHN